MVKVKKADGRLSRTVYINAGLAALSTAVGLVPQLQGVLPPQVYPWLLVSITLLNVFLRQITTQPLQ